MAQISLKHLIDETAPDRVEGLAGRRPEDVLLAGVTPDSRAVKAGFVFGAMPGTNVDGGRFAPQAVAAGAAVVLASPESDVGDVSEAVVLRFADVRRALALAARAFHPGQPSVSVAVTGTNGKTSVAAFVRQIWEHLGHRAASLGTVGLVVGDEERAVAHTTPEPVTLHAMLDAIAAEGVTHLALEASSHGLQQRRVHGVRLQAAAFTNITRDHLDYHPTFEDYFAQKLRLFREVLTEDGVAVINVDVDEAATVVEAVRTRGQKLITVGSAGRPHGEDGLVVDSIVADGFAQVIALRFRGRSHEVRLPLAGNFQASNALVAAGLVLATGGAPDDVFAALEHLKGAKGRLDLVAKKAPDIPVFVDYAHTPDALTTALAALRPFTTARLIAVFGCGGDRDPGKRPQMAAACAANADVTIVTDDNPRGEDPAAIRAQTLGGAPGALEVADRAIAIQRAIDMAEPGDVVLVAGKGHETGQIVGDKVLPFSDHDVVLEHIASLNAGQAEQ